ncbi:MAG TPA: hypothetical protein VMD51_05290 [Mycobacterium sp.]|nr:hypothetical protein [Mycobacterium sp.]
MKFDPVLARSVVRRQLAGAVVGLMALGAVCAGTAYADPDTDTLANLTELSRQAQKLTDTIHEAQLDLEKKMQVLSEADKAHADDLAALDAAKAQLAIRQGTVDNVAAAVYMGGPGDSVTALLTAGSPQTLIDKLAFERVVTTQATDEMDNFRQAAELAEAIEASSAKSEADARAAVEAATAARTDLQNKQAELKAKIAADAGQAVLTAMPSSVMEALGYAAPIPTVGMSGLVPNARILVAYIMATYPGVQSIGGVRSDPLPDHPSGHAIDIMIGSDMTLGDTINADVQSQTARFGVKYTMWRVANHFNHVHVTVF